MDLSLSADSVSVEPLGFRSVSASITNVDSSEILEHFTAQDVITHFGVSAILDAIDISDATNHYGLVEPEF